MKNLNLSNLSVKKKLVAKYLEKDNPKQDTKRTDINVLLNRVKFNQKNESRKKNIFFSSSLNRSTLIWTNYFPIKKNHTN